MAEFQSILRRPPTLADVLPAVPTNDPNADFLARSGALQRGVASSLYGMGGGSYAADALDAERAGDMTRASTLRALADQQGEAAARVAPINDYRQIATAGDALEYAQGALGSGLTTMAPVLAGAAAGRFLTPLRAASYLGGAIPGYLMERNEAIQNQYADPVQAAVDPETRLNVARTKGAASGALEALVPGMLANRFAKPLAQGFTRTVGANMLQEGVTEGAQEFVGQKAQEYLNPERDTGDDIPSIINAGLQGAISGGGISVPSAAAGKAQYALMKGADTAYTDAKNLVLGDRAPGIVVDGDLEQTIKNIEASDLTRPGKAKLYAEELLSDPATPDDIRKKIDELQGDFSSPEAQSMVGNALLFQKAGKKASEALFDLKSGVEDFVSKAKTKVDESGAKDKASGLVEKARDFTIRKLNAQDPLLATDIEAIVSESLNPDLADQPAVQRQVPELAKLLTQLVSRGAEVDDGALRSFGGFKSLNTLFADPEAALDAISKKMGGSALSDRFTKINTATQDLKKNKGGRFMQAVPQAMRESVTPEVAREMASFIDDVTSGRVKSKVDPVKVLNEIYKDEAVSRSVLDFYQRKADPEGKYEQQANLTEQDESSKFLFANEENARPWHKTDLQKAVDTTKGQRGQRASRMVNMRDYAARNEEDPRAVIGKIYKDIQGRIAEEQKRLASDPRRQENIDRLTGQMEEISSVYKKIVNDPDLQDMSEDDRKTFAANNALQNFVVGEVHGPANEEANPMQADNSFIKQAKRGLRAKERNPAEQVVFETKDGKGLVLHAPSMVRAMSIRQGSGKGEGRLNRAARLLKDAVTSVLGREEVTGIKTDLEQVEMFGTNLKEIDAGSYGVSKRRELIDQLRKTKDPAKREKLIAKINDMTVEAPENVDNAKPRTELEKDLVEEGNGDKFTLLADYATLGADQLQEVRESIDEAILDIQKRNAPLRQEMEKTRRDMEGEKDKEKWAQFSADMKQGRKILKFRQEELAAYYELQNSLDEIDSEQRGGVVGVEDFEDQDGTPRSVQESSEQPRYSDEEKMGGAPAMKMSQEDMAKKEDAGSFDPDEPPPPSGPVGKPKQKITSTEAGGKLVEKNPREAPAGTIFRSMQDVHQDPSQFMDQKEADEVRAEIERMRGKDIKVVVDQFAKDIGASGDYIYRNGKRMIRVAVNALDPLGVAYHESMHDFFVMLNKDPGMRQTKRILLEAASSPAIMAQLKKLLAKHPDALKQIESDAQERLSYAFQFWATKQLRVGPQTENIFQKIMKYIRELLGVVTKSEKMEQIFLALHEGKMAQPNTVAAVLADMHVDTIGEKARDLSGPVYAYADKLFTGATDRLRDSGVEAFTELADLFHRDPNNEKGGLGFLQKRAQVNGKFMNQLQLAIGDASHTDVATALEELRLMKTPTTPVGIRIKALLNDLHDYMVDAGVQRRQPDGSWGQLGKVQNYFPRVWDKATIRANEKEFKDLMAKYTTASTANDIFKAVMAGDGSLDVAESERHVGFTPFSQAVNKRRLDFVNEKTAHEFTKFMSNDMIETMSTYIFQAVHRGEYARSFGNDGQVISNLMMQAQNEGATPEEIAEAGKIVRAMEGTLGHDMNPRLRDIMTGLIAYENIVLLPFAIFASLIDPLGVAIRSNDIGEGWKAAKRGVKQIAQTITGTYKKDAEYELARTLGLIDENNMMEQMGQVYAGQYMGKTLKKMNDKFFRWNGLESWNQGMRIAAMSAAQRFMVRNKNNSRYMQELGLQASDIKELPNGGIALTQSQGLTAAEEKRVQEAVFRWVDGAVLRPNAAHRPVWGSDPHWMLVFHLKQFTYTFQNTVLKRVREEFQNGNTKPAWILASYVPFMIFSDLLKAALTGNIKTNWDIVDYVAHGVSRSGALGIGNFGFDAMGDMARGRPPIASFLGPTAGHALTIMESLGPQKDFGDVLLRSVPAAPLVKSFV